MVEYRLLSELEMPAALRLWVNVFGVEAQFFQTLLDSAESDDFSVGAFDGRKLVSSVHVFTRRFRDTEGNPNKVGGIGSVSTLPGARSKGHSSRLLQMSIAEMAARGFQWSYLGTGVNDHYARHGWRSVSTPYFKGTIREPNPSGPIEKAEVTDALLAEMAIVHEAHTAKTPMANARSKKMWDHAVRYRLTCPPDEVFTSYEGGKLAAYLVTRQFEDNLQFVESACLVGAEDSLRDLVQGRLGLAASKGMTKIGCSLAAEDPAVQICRSACPDLQPAEDRAWMVQPIADRISLPALVSIHADPRARRSDLDNF